MKASLKEFHPARILIRSTNWIGDAIMTTPAVRTIRENFPAAEITMLAQPWMADVFRASPHVDKIIFYEKKGVHGGLSGMLRLSRTLQRMRFDMAILLQNAFEAALLARMAGIPVRAGYKRDGRSLLLTHGVRIRDEIRGKHQVHYYQALLRDLGLTRGPDELCLRLADEDLHFARRFRQGLAGGGPVIGLNPGAAYGPAKCWPAARYGELAERLHRRNRATFMVFGTAADQQTIDTITAHGPGFIRGLAGKTTLAQAMALISVCDAFVTNDSGLMHVGAATGTPLVAIFGSTDAVATGPFSDRAVVLQKELGCRPCLKKECKADFRCMLDISVEEVEQAVQKLLGEYEACGFSG
ncbi:MAG: lipopolysaccharide heptosyltransferase II [Deltaproteobacteria bacterium]|nr:lipopolysaccharide heptosyltransferase II [Deltaproteobacteria bacterium]